MPDRVSLSGAQQSLRQVVAFHEDSESALRLYYSPVGADGSERFGTYSGNELRDELTARLLELDCLSTLALLAAVEAVFRIDYLTRCYRRRKDRLSLAFRSTHRQKGPRASLEDDILGPWQQHDTRLQAAIGSLKDAFRYRHWLAHGRYWTAKLGRADGRYDFETVFELAEALLAELPLMAGGD